MKIKKKLSAIAAAVLMLVCLLFSTSCGFRDFAADREAFELLKTVLADELAQVDGLFVPKRAYRNSGAHTYDLYLEYNGNLDATPEAYKDFFNSSIDFCNNAFKNVFEQDDTFDGEDIDLFFTYNTKKFLLMDNSWICETNIYSDDYYMFVKCSKLETLKLVTTHFTEEQVEKLKKLQNDKHFPLHVYLSRNECSYFYS